MDEVEAVVEAEVEVGMIEDLHVQVRKLPSHTVLARHQRLAFALIRQKRSKNLSQSPSGELN